MSQSKNMPLGRPQRVPHRQGLGPAARANEEEIGEIDRADEQKKQHAALQEHEGWPHFAHVIRSQGIDSRAESAGFRGGGLRVGRQQRGIQRIELPLRLGHGSSRRETGDHESDVVVTPGREPIIRIVRSGPEKLRATRKKAKARRKHANHRDRQAVVKKRLPDHRRIRVKICAPELVGEHRNLVRAPS